MTGVGVPHPDLGGGGYPIQLWPGGTPSKPVQGGTLGTPTIQTWPGGTLGTPTIQTWLQGILGTPLPSRPGWRTPSPTIQTWMGYSPPPSRPGWGTPHHQDLARYLPLHPDLTGVPPHHPDLAGVPPPVKVWTDKQTENSTFPHPSDAGCNKKVLLENSRHKAR